jgi:DNA-binding NarL/FixJ family response regulator
MSPEVAKRVVELFRKSQTPEPSAVSGLFRRTATVAAADARALEQDCGAEIGINVHIVFHLRSIYEKLHVHSRSEAVARTLRGSDFTRGWRSLYVVNSDNFRYTIDI